MKIVIAQIRPIKGDIDRNLQNQLMFIEKAAELNADLIVFPELSLTGYEPELAGQLAIESGDERLDAFQESSVKNRLTVCTSAPLRVKNGIQIGMFIFSSGRPVETYAKQFPS